MNNDASPVEQNTIENISVAYLKLMIIFLIWFFCPMKTWKNLPQRLLIIGPIFFLYANRPKTSSNLNFCSIKNAYRVTYI